MVTERPCAETNMSASKIPVIFFFLKLILPDRLTVSPPLLYLMGHYQALSPRLRTTTLHRKAATIPPNTSESKFRRRVLRQKRFSSSQITECEGIETHSPERQHYREVFRVNINSSFLLHHQLSSSSPPSSVRSFCFPGSSSEFVFSVLLPRSQWFRDRRPATAASHPPGCMFMFFHF